MAEKTVSATGKPAGALLSIDATPGNRGKATNWQQTRMDAGSPVGQPARGKAGAKSGQSRGIRSDHEKTSLCPGLESSPSVLLSGEPAPASGQRAKRASSRAAPPPTSRADACTPAPLTKRSDWIGDHYIGTMEALVAAGFAALSEFPGQPGCGKMMCSYACDGRRIRQGQTLIRFYRKITRRGASRFFCVTVAVPDEERERRRVKEIDLDRIKRDGHSAQVPMSRPWLRLIWNNGAPVSSVREKTSLPHGLKRSPSALLPGAPAAAGVPRARVASTRAAYPPNPHEESVITAALAIHQGRLRKPGAIFDSPAVVKNFVHLHLARREAEAFAVLFLDSGARLLAFEVMFEGTLTHVSVYPREIVKRALALNAAAVVLAHNHPSGVAEPSRDDELVTQGVRAALQLVDVRVIDHLVVGVDAVLSFAELGLLNGAPVSSVPARPY